MSYYIMECYPDDDNENEIGGFAQTPLPNGIESWITGQPFDKQIDEPILYEMMDHLSDGLLEMDNTTGFVISKKLFIALKEAGVDNLQCYDTVIKHNKTGFESFDYVSVNVIGLVKAVDMSKSKIVGGSSDGLIDVDFEGLTIDPEETSNLLLFRLAENPNAIVVHESVKKSLLNNGFHMLDFIDPEDWIG